MTDVVEVVTQTNTVEVIGSAGAVVEVISQPKIVVEVLTAGAQGPAGAGLSPGGTTGQVLAKVSDTDFDTQWVNPANDTALTWDYLAANWTHQPLSLGSLAGGEVWQYALRGDTRYRFVPAPYDPVADAFYSTFTGGVLSDMIVARG